MSDLYAKVTRTKGPDQPSKRRRGAGIYIALVCAVIVLIVLFLILLRVFSLRPQFSDFVADLSNSTSFTYRRDTLRAEFDGQTVSITGENAYAVYNTLTVRTPSGFLRSVPDGEPDITLDYGNGSILRLWASDRAGRPYGIRLSFTSGDGDQYLFRMDSVDMGSLRNMLSPENNPQ